MSAPEMNGRSQSLYRKYRPTTFAEDELVGQEHVSRTLRNAVRHDRVAHAYLFCGPRGSGKTSSARLLAKAVNCEDPDPAKRPCNACASCRLINEGRATDIIEIDAASHRGIDDIRDLRERVKFSPAQLRKKLYIIDEVHQLTRDGSNALLKTLEEPPPHAIFILATTDPEKVLDTINSRCQTFIFHRIPIERIIEHLRRVAEKEGIKADDAALALIARSATGAMRDALGLLDQLSSYGSTEEGITADTVRQLLGAGDSAHVAALVDAIAAGDTGEGLRVINAVVDGGADVRQFAAQIVAYLRALLHASAAAGRGGAPQDATVTPAHLEALTLGEIAALVKRFSQVDYGLRHSSYGHLPLELCLVDSILARSGAAARGGEAEAIAPRQAPAAPRAMPTRPTAVPTARPPQSAETPPATPPERTPTPLRPVVAAPSAPAPTPAARSGDDDWSASLVADEPAPTLTPTAAPAAPEPAPAAPAQGSISIEEVHDRWSRIRQMVRASSRRIEALLASADPLQIDAETLTLVAAYDFHRDGLNKDDTRKVIEEVIAQVLGHPYRIHCFNQEEARALPAASVAAPVPAPAVAAAPPPAPVAPPPAPAAPARAMPDEEPPPWSEPNSAQATPPQRVAQNGEAAQPDPAQPAAPTRPQAHHIREGAPPAAPIAVDERYVNAIKNLFNAVEIQPDGGATSRPRWGN